MKTLGFFICEMKGFIFFLLIITFFSFHLKAQNITVTDSTEYIAKSSAILDVQSFSKGMLVPRMSTSKRLNISNPVDGLLVYDTDKNSFYYNQNNEWIKLPKVNENLGNDEPLFYVNNASNDTIFAVYNDGVKITLHSDPNPKGKVGGFAISGRSTGKQDSEFNILEVNQDCTRIYIDTSASKGIVGGFAVSGRSTGKGDEEDFFNISGKQTTEIIDPSKSRILWYPKKEAFLTGRVLIESPDSVGTNSMATGFESKAIGDFSQALGYMPVARGNYSTAIGNVAISDGNNSFAFGDNAKALAEGSYAIGTAAQAKGLKSFSLGSSGQNNVGDAVDAPVASGDYAYAFGMGSIASGFGAYALGLEAKATGMYSFSFGNNTQADGASSLALGDGATTSSWYGIAMGEGANSIGEGAVAMGQSTTAEGDHSYCFSTHGTAFGYHSAAFGDRVNAGSESEIAVGSYNDISPFPGNKSSWNELDPIFLVGNGQYIFGTGEVRRNALVILKNGKVGIGTSTPSELLTVYNGTSTGTYTTSGWQHASDRRLKTNIKPITSSLHKIQKLQGVFFDWKTGNEKRQTGLIAQDVEPVIPEVVSKNNEGYYSIAYGNLSPLIIEAIKEQQNIIKTQEEKISDLENRIFKLEEMLMNK